MAKQDLLMHTGHRERLREKFVSGHASPAEEIELLLTYVIPRRDVRVLSRRLIEKFGTAYNVLLAKPEDVMAIPGIGPGAITFFNLLRSIVSQGYKKHMVDSTVFCDTHHLIEYCRMNCMNKPYEHLHVMYLDIEGRLIEDELHSIGDIDYAGAYERKIVAKALMNGTVHIVLYHNHPVGGQTVYSTDDLDFTIRLGRMLLVHNIKIYDHFIVNEYGEVYAMRANGALGELDKYQADLSRSK